MRRWSHTVRLTAACWLLLAAPVCLAATPLTDELVASLQAAYERVVTPGDKADTHKDLFATVLNRVQRSYVEEVDFGAIAAAALKVLEPLPPAAGEPAEVFRKAINEGLRTLDRYSRYTEPQPGGSASDGEPSFGGVGLEVEPGAGYVRVIAAMPGTPAARAGMQAGDLIVRVDDVPLQGVALGDAIARMRGEPGTDVTITVRRAEQEFTVSLKRDTIRRPLLRTSMEGDVLVLRLGSFSGPVTSALEGAVQEATAGTKPRGVVLDLRGNPGGLLREGVTVADAFLSRGDIVSLRGRSPFSQRSWQADAFELLPGVPMVVLVDSRTASASELVADALQHHGRATVMGQRSFGKGTVQTTYPLGAQKGSLKLTTSLYVGPSGQSVQKGGVMPDIELLVPAPPAEAITYDAPPPRTPAARVEPSRCAFLSKAQEPALACAVAFLHAGSVERFTAALSVDAAP